MWVVIKQRFNTKETSCSEEKKDELAEEIMGEFDTLKKAVMYRNLLEEYDNSREYKEYSGMWNALYIKEGM